jgi:hypothetical protein
MEHEAFRQDADDLHVRAVHRDGAAQYCLVSAVTTLPELMGNEGATGRSSLLFGSEVPAEHRVDAQHREEVPGDHRSADFSRVAATSQRGSEADCSGHVLEHR